MNATAEIKERAATITVPLYAPNGCRILLHCEWPAPMTESEVVKLSSGLTLLAAEVEAGEGVVC